MAELLRSVHDILDGETSTITIRHLFYRLVGRNVILKTELAYKGLCGHLSRWRKSEEVPYDAFLRFDPLAHQAADVRRDC
jgi:hypothetical protein